jgi:hypothetical protein
LFSIAALDKWRQFALLHLLHHTDVAYGGKFEVSDHPVSLPLDPCGVDAKEPQYPPSAAVLF